MIFVTPQFAPNSFQMLQPDPEPLASLAHDVFRYQTRFSLPNIPDSRYMCRGPSKRRPLDPLSVRGFSTIFFLDDPGRALPQPDPPRRRIQGSLSLVQTGPDVREEVPHVTHDDAEDLIFGYGAVHEQTETHEHPGEVGGFENEEKEEGEAGFGVAARPDVDEGRGEGGAEEGDGDEEGADGEEGEGGVK